jgi:hypothetical protein
MRALVLVAALVAAGSTVMVVSACGTTDGRQDVHWTGTVTTVSPFCVGRAAAGGACFPDAPAGLVRGLTVGDCVEITGRTTPDSDALALTSAQHAEASSDPGDCG